MNAIPWGRTIGAVAVLTFLGLVRADRLDAQVRISEIHYNPAGEEDSEFIELRNDGGSAVSLAGFRFTNGIDFTFPAGRSLAPGAHLVLVANATDFGAVYPGVTPAGTYTGRLTNSGERVTLENGAAFVFDSVDYNDSGFWPVAADGFGWSIVLADPGGDPDDGASWRASAERGGSPGAADPEPRIGGVVFNEVLALTTTPLEDAVELRNVTAASIDISGWYLGDSRDVGTSLRRFRIPDGTVLEAGGYAAFYQGAFGFDIDASDPEVYLSAFDAEGRLQGYIVSIGVDAAGNNVAMGRHAGESVDFVPLSAPTFGVDAPATVEEFRAGTGATNAAPKVGPVVINEIMYHPADDESEFLELHNISGSAIALHESASRAWEIDGIRNSLETADFRFPQGASIPPEGYVLVVAGSPDVFRADHDVPDEVPIFGPFGGGLANEGERLRLFKPGASFGTRVLVDLVRYDDNDPWAESPDGDGPSLERIRTSSYANDSANWGASTVDDGTPGARNTIHEPALAGGLQLPGDCNQDGAVDLSDGVCLLRHLFVGSTTPPPCGPAANEGGNRDLFNSNGDGLVDLSDVVYVFNYLFAGGPPPVLGAACVPIEGCPDVCGVP